MYTHQCPKCSEDLTLEEKPRVGQVVRCQNCSTKIEVLWLFPLELGVVKNPAADRSLSK